MESESIKININGSTEYVELIKTLYMFFIVIIVWHILLCCCKKQPINIGLTGSLFNINFINFLLTGMISFLVFI